MRSRSRDAARPIGRGSGKTRSGLLDERPCRPYRNLAAIAPLSAIMPDRKNAP